MSSRVAVITGGNSGIGYALADQLLTKFAAASCSFSLCLACRNLNKAKFAKDRLLLAHPDADISIVQLDTSNVQSVKNAAFEISTRYKHVDWLFLNAGQMPPSSVNWRGLFPLTVENIRHVFATGGSLLRQTDTTMDNGLSSVFATNVFGHYGLVRQLEPFIAAQDTPCHLIWTSSRSAEVADPVDPLNIQHFGRDGPYENSKQLIDIISMQWNEQKRTSNAFSHTACPGIVMTELTNSILPKYFWMLVWPILFLIRAFISRALVISPALGAYSLFWLSQQDPKKLDNNAKYLSCSQAFGSPYVQTYSMSYSVDKKRILHEVEQLYLDYF